VLKNAALEARQFEAQWLAIDVDRFNDAVRGARDLGVDPWEGQAAFLQQGLVAGAFDNLRIDQGQVEFRLLYVTFLVHHQDALTHAHLGRCKPDPVALEHARVHTFDQFGQPTVKGRNRISNLAQNGAGVEREGEFGRVGHGGGLERRGVEGALTALRGPYSIFRRFIRRPPGGSSLIGRGPFPVVDYSKHIQKAEEAARRRNYDFAIQLFQQLLEIDPDVGEARAGLRRVLKARHEKKKGGKLFGMLKGAGPLAAAKTLAKAGKHNAASKQLESYLATNPMDEDANLLLGICLESGGHTHSALAVYEFLTEVAPRNPEGLKRAGSMMRVNGDAVRALEYYERALEADPRDRDAIKARKDLAAEAALSRSRFDEVSHSRDQIKDKDEAMRLERSQRLHQSEDDLREQLERLEAGYASEPSNVDTMLSMADLHEKLRDPEAAADLVERALSYRKGSVDLAERLGRLRLKGLKKAIARAGKAGDEQEADRLEGQLRELEFEETRRRLELTPGDAALRLTLGTALLRQGNYDEAAAELQKAVVDPRQADEAHIALAQCFQAKGFLDLARSEYEKALAAHSVVDETAREILYNLGQIAEAEGNPAEARSSYARIFEVDIGYRDVSEKMERLK